MILSWQKSMRLLAMLICTILSFSVAAQDVPDSDTSPNILLLPVEEVEDIRRYSVEVIVFEYASSASAGNEIFEVKPPSEELEFGAFSEIPGAVIDDDDVVEYGDFTTVEAAGADSRELTLFGDPFDSFDENIALETIPALADVEFRVLTPEELTLGEIHEKLLLLDAYKPVLWGGWVQAIYEHETTPPVRLRVLGTPPLYIDGTLNLYLRNYLHLVVDITKEFQVETVQPVYRQEESARGTSGRGNRNEYVAYDTQTLLFRISEDRIFRSGHLRYYDHPRFGVLATVNRYEKIPGEEAEPLPDDEEDIAGREIFSRN